ncbi:MAG: hypothetical protein AAFN70_05680, partial [Planctomycetota bacterium]
IPTRRLAYCSLFNGDSVFHSADAAEFDNDNLDIQRSGCTIKAALMAQFAWDLFRLWAAFPFTLGHHRHP